MKNKRPTKAVILAGGKGTRIAEESATRPKPMIEIGGKPILWHIMKIYDAYGIKDFIICAGHKQHFIKEYFANYKLFSSDFTIKIDQGMQIGIDFHNENHASWNITIVDTGEETMTGGRIKKIAKYLNPDEDFCLTYGDGVSNIDIKKLIDFHQSHDKLATVTGVIPSARFGALKLGDNNVVNGFVEKPVTENGFINGGFFVLSPKVIDYIDSDDTIFEKGPLESLSKDGELMAYLHDDFWQPMDTLRDHIYLCGLWNNGKAPWKVW
ncbi:MAG: glucose-1-phosphate cytidylyltransferase [Rickettsiales bacterium]|jgi:glucose-1-phosphate cytidylyltransferase